MGRHARWVLAASFLLAAATIGLWYWFRVPTYSTSTDTHLKIRETEQKAAVRHRHVLVVFAANWCSDCHVLDELFERLELASVLSENFEVVYVNVGTGDRNRDLMAEYQMPFDEGIPAVAIWRAMGR